jgi:PAS domain S-box-containing protein
MVESVQDYAIFLLGTDGTVLSWNAGAEQLEGYRADEIVGRSFATFYTEEDLRAGKPRRALERAAAEGRFEDEGWRVRKDGSRVWASTVLTPVRDDDGRLVGFAKLTRDFTARRRMEEALRQSEQRLRGMFDHAAVGIVEVDRDDRIVAANERLLEILGYGREALLGKTIHDITHPEDQASSDRLEADVHEGRTPVADQEQRYVRADGTPIWVHVKTSGVRDAEGRWVRSVGTVEDVTSAKVAKEALAASEAKFRAVFERAAIGMGTVRFTDARWEDVNDVFCRMLGRTREEMLRTPWPEMTHPEDIAADLEGFRRLAAGSLEEYTVEKRFLHARGHAVWARLTLSVVRDAQGRPAYEIAIIEDIGDRKQAQAQLRAANERLREADRRKNDFLAVLSHELRNPLAPIKNSLFVLERALAGGSQARRAHEVIGRQVQHLTRLVDDLLDVTRISRGKVRLQREQVDLRELILRTAEDHRALFQASGIELRIDAGEPVRVNGDLTRLSQIVGNLLSNAAKFTARGGRVEVSLARAAGEAVIRVRDDGVGIPPELLPRMFEPFVQADATLDRSKGGLGLGLALVKGLAELHGGGVSAHSAGAGQGAEFVVRLPAVSAEAASSAPRASAAARPHPALRVLLIEDNADAAESLKEALELNGHTVEIARTGWEGLEKARAAPPDVVLCDIGLPGIDGFEVARRMRADPALRSAPLVALSGYPAPEDLERSRDAGFHRHLAKPPDLQLLERTLFEAREGRRFPGPPA